MQTLLNDLQNRLNDCLLAERRVLRRRLQGLQRRLDNAQPIDKGLAELQTAVDLSCERRRLRLASLPAPNFDAGLPIHQQRERIAATLRANPVVVICGETGSGKTTQLPQICLSLGLGAAGMIGHTQPRRGTAHARGWRGGLQGALQSAAILSFKEFCTIRPVARNIGTWRITLSALEATGDAEASWPIVITSNQSTWSRRNSHRQLNRRWLIRFGRSPLKSTFLVFTYSKGCVRMTIDSTMEPGFIRACGGLAGSFGCPGADDLILA